MPDGGGVEMLRRSADLKSQPRFLALSASDAAEDVIAVIRAGARGYVTKSISASELQDAIERVREGDSVFSPRLAGGSCWTRSRVRRPSPRPGETTATSIS